MFVIINRANLIAGITSEVKYVKRQENGMTVLTSAGDATAVYAADNDTFYPLAASGAWAETYRAVEAGSVPAGVVPGYWYYSGEFYTTPEKQAQLSRLKASDDALEILVDQEYRLTLLELGVN